jgi:hypothetical protein
MGEYFAGGHLRYLDGEWRDDNGDVVHIQQIKDNSCDGCKHIGFRYPYASMYPCNNCRRANSKDYYNVDIEG